MPASKRSSLSQGVLSIASRRDQRDSWCNESMNRKGSRSVVTTISLGLLALLLASCSAAGAPGPTAQPQESQSPTTNPSSTPDSNETSPEPTKTTPGKTATTKPPTVDTNPDEGSSSDRGNYITYDEYQSSPDVYASSEVVLFFNASWCSTCRIARDNFESSLTQIPADLTVVIVDFENSAELKKKHGVTYQHTLVHINDSGELLHKWSGSVTFAEIAEQIA